MTFDEIVTEVKDRLNLTSSDATTRLGRAVNVMYRRVTSGLGLQVARRITGVTAMTSLGIQTVTFTGVEKIERVIDDTDGTITELDERTFEEIRAINPNASDDVKQWAVESMGPSSVTIRLDVLPQTAFQLKADGLETAATLSGSQVPHFNQDFHDVLVEGVIADELRKQEKPVLAKIAQDVYDKRLSELRFFLAKSSNANLRAGGSQLTSSTTGGSGGGGGGSAPSGGTSYTQTGLVTFDRDPSAPFAVTDTSAYVPNLFVEGVGNVATDRLVGRDTAGTGESEQLTVGNGLEFTGAGGIGVANDGVTDARLRNSAGLSVIGRSANSTGDPADIAAANDAEVLRRSGATIGFGTVATAGIANDAVTYAKIQNVSAASRLLGRGSAAGSGDAEELTIGAGLSISGTVLDAPAVVQTTTSTGTSNDFAATAARRLVLRCNNASLLTLTGFAAGSDGDVIDVVSVGAGQVDLPHQSTGSSAANRLINVATSAASSLAAGTGTARYIYDGTTARWRMVAHDQGAWITPSFSAGDYTSGSGTWTVGSGDVTTNCYWLKGRTVTWNYHLQSTTPATTPSNLIVKIPGSFSSAKAMRSTGVANDNATFRPTRVDLTAGGTTATNTLVPAANFANSTDGTDLSATVVFEVT